MDKKLKTGILNIFSANVINLVLNIITSFILPKYLSVETYSAIKTFQLYIGYAGLLHLGYVDGMYLKYGGMDIEKINKNDFNKDLSTMRIFQFLMTIVWVTVGLIIHDYIIVAFGLAILPENMNSYFRYLFQSIGEFKRYRKILNITTIGTFLANTTLLFALKSNNSFMYCLLYVIIYIVSWLTLEIEIRKKIDNNLSIISFSKKCFNNNIKLGILLMLGTFSSIILTSIDRWFVKMTLETIDFAEYSFAVTMDNFVNVAITPITLTLYNYFCRKKENCNFEKIRSYIIITSIYTIAAFFPAKFILETYLTKYINSSIVLACLFASQLSFICVKSIYVNMYKYKKLQKKYFLKLLSVIIFGIMVNILIFKIYPYKESYAIGTLISSIYWLIISLLDFKSIFKNNKCILLLIVELILFLICACTFNSIIGFIIYVTISTLFIIISFKEDVIYLLKIIKS